MPRIVPFGELAAADLVVDAVYESSAGGQLAGEPIAKLLPGSGNMGGFRASGRGEQKNWIVLFTTGEDKDWPDTLDLNTGQFVYFGDNRTPGDKLHDTSAGGNKILSSMYSRLHDSANPRLGVAPFFIFRKYPKAKHKRSVQFKGLAVPGFPGLSMTEDLVAVWKASDGQRFQNYRAVFTILDAQVVPRTWIKELTTGASTGQDAPLAWSNWIKTGKYKPLTAEPTQVIRTLEAQAPDTPPKGRNLGMCLATLQRCSNCL